MAGGGCEEGCEDCEVRGRLDGWSGGGPKALFVDVTETLGFILRERKGRVCERCVRKQTEQHQTRELLTVLRLCVGKLLFGANGLCSRTNQNYSYVVHH